jgi:hypothetical protein
MLEHRGRNAAHANTELFVVKRDEALPNLLQITLLSLDLGLSMGDVFNAAKSTNLLRATADSDHGPNAQTPTLPA